MVNFVEPDIKSITSNFHDYSRIRDNYENSEQQQIDDYTKAHEEFIASKAEEELEKQNENNSDSILQNLFEVPADLTIGAVRGVGEIVTAFGGPENPFHLNDPDDTFSAIVQTGSQFLVPYTGAYKAVSLGTKSLNLLSKSPKLKAAVDSMIAGMPVDAFAFNPQDGNLFNFAVGALGISGDSRAGAAVKEYLAVKSDEILQVSCR